MRVFKCDLCGVIYETPTAERNGVVTIFDADNKMLVEHDCCPRCTRSIETMMQVLRQGDDYNLHVIPKVTNEEETK